MVFHFIYDMMIHPYGHTVVFLALSLYIYINTCLPMRTVLVAHVAVTQLRLASTIHVSLVEPRRDQILLVLSVEPPRVVERQGT